MCIFISLIIRDSRASAPGGFQVRRRITCSVYPTAALPAVLHPPAGTAGTSAGRGAGAIGRVRPERHQRRARARANVWEARLSLPHRPGGASRPLPLLDAQGPRKDRRLEAHRRRTRPLPLRVCLPSSQAGRLHEPLRLRLPGDGGDHCHPANAASRPLTLARPAASSGKNSAEHAFRKRLKKKSVDGISRE